MQVVLQGFNVLAEGFDALGRDAAQGAGTPALVGLLHLDVASCRQLFYLHAQVARRCARLLPDVGELGLFNVDEHGHHRQAQFGVE